MGMWSDSDPLARAARHLLVDDGIRQAIATLVPHGGPSGVRAALRGYVRAGGPRIDEFEYAVERLEDVIGDGAERPPLVSNAPVTRYWIDHAHRLPPSFAVRVGIGFSRLVQRKPAARVNGSVLYAAVRDLAKHLAGNPAALERLASGDDQVVFDAAIWAGLAPRVAQDRQTALRTALQLAAGPARLVRFPGSSKKGGGRRQKSLQEMLETVAPHSKRAAAGLDEHSSEQRRGWGLATRRAAGIAIGLDDIDPLEVAELLETLDCAGLAVGNREILQAMIQVSYLTGWSFDAIAQGEC